MVQIVILLSGLCLFWPTLTQAASKTNILRGGYGFLYPDHNSFINPGQFAVSHGAAFETSYAQVNGGGAKSLTPSFVLGKGKWGIGAFANRVGSALDSQTGSVDSIGGGFGLSLMKERLTLGASYFRSIDTSQASDGDAALTLTMNGPKRMGPSVGIGLNTSVNQAGGDRQGGVLGLGYSFKSNVNFEANYTQVDFQTSRNYRVGAFGTYAGRVFYLGMGYQYANVNTQHLGRVRGGFVIGRYIDLSAFADQVLEDGGQLSYGASVRASF